jgi:putative chitinase
MLPIDANTVFAMAPHFSGQKAENQERIVESFGKILAPTLASFQIDTLLRIAHFLAQTCHESAGFRTTEEFASGDAYEGRADLGNTHPGDGRRYKGRGLIQLTGRFNYQKYGNLIGVDLVDDPERAGDPQLSLKLACEYWDQNHLNALADNDDLITITRRINGGLNGLDDRRALLVRAKAVLTKLAAGEMLDTRTAVPVAALRRGSTGPEVGVLQARLRAEGIPIAIDGDFGAATELAVKQFQAKHGLEADGIVGPQTWDALKPPGDGVDAQPPGIIVAAAAAAAAAAQAVAGHSPGG